VPAREGALRVLAAARDAGVKRVVLTSSFAAVGYGQPPQQTPFNETNWTNPDAGGVYPYVKSKTLAESAAWDFIAREGGSLELAVVNPAGVLGPVLPVQLVSVQAPGKPIAPKIGFLRVHKRPFAAILPASLAR